MEDNDEEGDVAISVVAQGQERWEGGGKGLLDCYRGGPP